MKRLLLAAAIGMVVYFIWGMLSWAVFQMHGKTYLPWPENQDGTVQQIVNALPESGVYYYPAAPTNAADEQAQAHYQSNVENGPLFSLFIHHGGQPLMDWRQFVKAGITYFLLCFLLAFLLQQVLESLGSWAQRTVFVSIIGLLAVGATYIDNWIWLYHPLPYVIAMSLDLAIRWILLGSVIALIIKPSRRYKVSSL